MHTPSDSSRAIPTIRPVPSSSSRATTTCRDCSKERRRAAAVRPLSKSSAARSALARAQSTPSRERSRRTRTAPAWHRSVAWPRWSMLSGVDVRPRRPSDIEPLLEMARLVKDVDGYPPAGPSTGPRSSPPRRRSPPGWPTTVPRWWATWRCTPGARPSPWPRRHATPGAEPDALALVARVLVRPSARRSGVGHALLEVAVADAHRRGLRPILDVATQLRGAVALYEVALVGTGRRGDHRGARRARPAVLRLRRAGAVTTTGPDALAVTRR